MKAMQTYLVGGAVRDKLLGLSPGDRDFVVVGETQELDDACSKRGRLGMKGLLVAGIGKTARNQQPECAFDSSVCNRDGSQRIEEALGRSAQTDKKDLSRIGWSSR